MISHTVYDDTLTVSLRGEIDHHTAKNFSTQTDDLIKQFSPKTLVLDFGGVTFCDSSGIAVVLGRYKFMKKNGGETELSSVPPSVRKIFALAAIDKLVKTRQSTI